MTRINDKFTRVYNNGLDISGYANAVGSLDWLYSSSPNSAYSDQVFNSIAGRVTISAGTINAFLDNDTAGLLNQVKTATDNYNLMVAFGTNAVSVAGDPFFAWKFEQMDFQAGGGDGFLPVTIPVGSASYSGTLTHSKPWGVVLHASGAETAVNTAIGIDDRGAASALGGIFVYHLLSSNGTVTIKAQDAATNLNASFADITGATSGSIDATTTPVSNMIALGTTAAIRRYLRWQIVLGTATTATFICGLIRN
jgi:hypothetical protein